MLRAFVRSSTLLRRIAFICYATIELQVADLSSQKMATRIYDESFFKPSLFPFNRCDFVRKIVTTFQKKSRSVIAKPIA